MHEHHLRADVPGEGHLVSHHQHGHALLGQRLHDVQHLAHHFRVQSGGGLVEQQHLRVHGQRPGDGHPLLLTAGDLPGLGVDIGGHTHLFQIFQCLLPGLLLAALEDLHLSHHAVFEDRHIVEQVEGLEHHAHMGAVLRGIDAPARHIGAVVEDLTAAGGLQQVDTPQQRGLAGAGSADDGNNVALLDSKVNIPQNLMGAKGLAEVTDL